MQCISNSQCWPLIFCMASAWEEQEWELLRKKWNNRRHQCWHHVTKLEELLKLSLFHLSGLRLQIQEENHCALWLKIHLQVWIIIYRERKHWKTLQDDDDDDVKLFKVSRESINDFRCHSYFLKCNFKQTILYENCKLTI